MTFVILDFILDKFVYGMTNIGDSRVEPEYTMIF